MRRPKAVSWASLGDVVRYGLGIIVVLYLSRTLRRVGLEAMGPTSRPCRSSLEAGQTQPLGLEPTPSSLWVASEPPAFALYRFIGNNIVPLQCYGQLYKNTRYTLDYEPKLRDCRKLWVINNIVNRTERGMLLDLLLSRGYTTEDVIVRRLNFTELAVMPEDERMSTVTAQNEARNFMVRHGIAAGARWILPFDGNQFYTTEAWESIRAAGARWDAEGFKYFKVPMYRVYSEQKPSWLNASTKFTTVQDYAPVLWESQFAVRNDSEARYKEGTKYGKDNKLEMLDRVCGTGNFGAKMGPRAEGKPADTGLCGCHLEVGNDRRKREIKEHVALRCGYSVRLWYFPCAWVNASLIFEDTIYRANLRTEGHDRLVAEITHEIELATH